MAGIFISYRRSDSGAIAARLGDDLAARFGRERVFADLDYLQGDDWLGAIERQLDLVDVVLVLIGPRWLQPADGDARPRLFQTGDFVCAEVAAALRRNLRTVPLLVDGARFPASEDLPSELQPLVRRQAMELNGDRWKWDFERLATALQGVLPAPAPASPIKSWFKRQWGEPAASGPPAAPPTAPLPRAQAPARAPASAPVQAPMHSPLRSPGPNDVPAHTVFVSHSSQDRPQVEQVVAALEAAGHRCWVSYRDLPEGDPAWSASIMAALRTSRAMVVVLTPQSNRSRHVLREVTVADEKRIACVPLKTHAVTLDESLAYFFTTTQQLDATALPWPQALDRLVAAVRRALAGPLSPSS